MLEGRGPTAARLEQALVEYALLVLVGALALATIAATGSGASSRYSDVTQAGSVPAPITRSNWIA